MELIYIFLLDFFTELWKIEFITFIWRWLIFYNKIIISYGSEDEKTWQLPLIKASETAIKEATTRHNITVFFEDRETIKKVSIK